MCRPSKLKDVRDRPFNLQGGGGYDVFFVQKFFFRTTQELEYSYFLSRKARNFFPEFNIRLCDKNSESDYFFSSSKIRIFFFSNIGNQNIFFRKKNITLPPPLQGKWSFPNRKSMKPEDLYSIYLTYSVF